MGTIVAEKKEKEKKPTVKRKKRISVVRNRVREVAAKKGISLQEIADRIPTNAPHLWRIMGNQRPCISLPTAIRIAQILETPVEQLFIIERPKGE